MLRTLNNLSSLIPQSYPDINKCVSHVEQSSMVLTKHLDRILSAAATALQHSADRKLGTVLRDFARLLESRISRDTMHALNRVASF